jgi:hypothetical protein
VNRTCSTRPHPVEVGRHTCAQRCWANIAAIRIIDYIDPTQRDIQSSTAWQGGSGEIDLTSESSDVTAVFDEHGLFIQYPENWKLEQHEDENHSLEIQIIAPSGAFWSLLVFDRQVDNGGQLMQEILQGIDDQYESAEWSRVTEALGSSQTSGYDTFFFCLDLLITNRMRCLERGDQNWLLTWQAENREFDSIEPVFRAMTISLLSSPGVSRRP